jgi:mitochondrial fission protein ELM1
VSEILIISDRKPGHVNQSLGLVEALMREKGHLTYKIVPSLTLMNFFSGLKRLQQLKSCKLVVGAGHRTHLTLLMTSWLLNAKSIVIMKPSLPHRWFDLCVIPAHDRVPQSANVLISTGALNRVVPGLKQENRAIMMLGGPSKHFLWDSERVFQGMSTWFAKYPDLNWTVTTSRRTPKDLVEMLSKASNDSYNFFPYEETESNWLATTLASSEYAVVTIDSVSMIYESLTAGCKLGAIELDCSQAKTKVAVEVLSLLEKGLIRSTELGFGSSGDEFPVLNESKRVAKQLVEKKWI